MQRSHLLECLPSEQHSQGQCMAKRTLRSVHMLYAAKYWPELGRLGHTWAAHAADTVAAASVCTSASKHMISVTSENVLPAENASVQARLLHP